VMYQHLVNLCGGVVRCVDTYPDFALDPAGVEAALSERTKVIILNSPANPTGAVYEREALEAVAALARRRGILVISDEIYSEFVYDGPYASIGEVYDRTLLLDGFSKTYGMTGWRVGFAVGPPDVIEKMTMLQQYSFVCAPSALQVGLAGAFQVDMSGQIAAYQRKRDMVIEAFDGVAEMIRPGGAFYAFVQVPTRLGLTATAFVERAIERNVLAIPGGVFSRRDTHFRISYAVTDEKLGAGLAILRELLSQGR